MENKKGILSTVFLVITIILIVVMGAFMYMQKTESDKQIAELENNASKMQETINDLQGKIDSISNNSENNSSLNDISCMIVSIEDTSAGEQSYKSKKIIDKQEIATVLSIINNATEYEIKSSNPDLDEYPSTIEMWDSNGRRFTIASPGDQINDDGNIVNLMTKWDSQDGSKKTLYKVDVKLAKYINNLYNKYDNAMQVNKENLIEENNIERLAQNTLDKYINLRKFENGNVGPMPYILVDLGLETRENIEQLCKGVNNSDTYIKSNTNYEKFKEALLQYVTEDYFIENFSQYRNMDGYIGFCNCAAGIPTSEIESVKLKNKNSENYIFEVTLKDCEMYDHYLDGEQIDEGEWLYNQEVTFKYVNNILVISKIK